MDFKTELQLSEALCTICIWKEHGDCDDNTPCKTYKYVERKDEQ